MVEIFKAFLYRGIPENLDKKRKDFFTRGVSCNFISLIGIALAIPFLIAALAKGNIVLASVEIIVILLVATNTAYLWVTGRVDLASINLLVFVSAFYFFLYINGSTQHTGLYWSFAIPILSYFLGGRKLGQSLSLVYLTLTVLVYLLTNFEVVKLTNYTSEVFYRYIAVYVVIFSVVYVYASSLNEYSKILDRGVTQADPSESMNLKIKRTWLSPFESYFINYAFYGTLFGLVFPLMATPLRAYLIFGEINLDLCLKAQAADPLLWIIDTAPFFLGLFASFGGMHLDKYMVKLEETNELREEADRANQAKSQFLSNMTHEIRTPINGVIGYTEMLIESDTLSKSKECARTIMHESEHLLKLVNNVLDYAKIESGKLELEKKAFNLEEQIELVISLTNSKAVQKGIFIKTKQSEKSKRSYLGDALRLRQIIVNLVGNAIKFTEEGYIEIGVEVVSAREEGHKLLFYVQDQGIGIPEERQGAIFEKFTQVDESTARKYGGTGLGTSIAFDLVELMGGEMDLQSKEGRGSRFSFTIELPLAEGIKNTRDAEKVVSDYEVLKEKKVLIVDDYETNRTIFSSHLQSYRINVSTAENGEIALEKCRVEDFDLILMDVQMPEMDGYESTREIRKLTNRNSGIIILGLTANADSLTVEKCLKSGMNKVLSKPIKKLALINNLHEFLSESIEKEKIMNVDTLEQALAKKESDEIVAENKVLPIDFNEAVEEFGDRETVIEVVDQFLVNLDKQIIEIKDFIKEKWLDVSRHGHAIKGGAASIEALPLSEAAKTLEELAKKSNDIFSSGEIKKAASELFICAKELKVYYNSLIT